MEAVPHPVGTSSVLHFSRKSNPRWGKYGNAAVIHDWMYWDQSRKRQEADQIFLEGMGVLEVPNWKRHIIYYAVRWFGWLAWSSNQRKKGTA